MMQGLLAGIQAAQAIASWDSGSQLPADFKTHAWAAIDKYQQDWGVRPEPNLAVTTNRSQSNFTDSVAIPTGKSYIAMRQ